MKAASREAQKTVANKLDELVRTWDKDGSFKRKLSKYYKQFYHKTDKVFPRCLACPWDSEGPGEVIRH